MGWAVMCGWLGESTAAGLGCRLRASGLGLRAAGCGLRVEILGRLVWSGPSLGCRVCMGCVLPGLGHGLPRGLRAQAELYVGQSGLRSSGWARSRGLVGGLGLDLRGATLCANRMLASLVGVS